MRKNIFPIILVFCFWAVLIALISNGFKTFFEKQNTGKFGKKFTSPQNNLQHIWYKKIDEIPLPNGFVRIPVEENSFASFLRQLPLRKDNTVYLFNQTKKRNQKAQFAVLDLPIGHQDLQQCADAVMRIRAEYLFANHREDEIFFADNNGRKFKLAKGCGKNKFDNYLNKVFAACGSYSLSKQLKARPFSNMQMGDVLIRGGFPGHAVLVVDMAENLRTNQNIYMLAQGYMPAQDIHVLRNASSPETAWYPLNSDRKIDTPEYTFYSNELMGW